MLREIKNTKQHKGELKRLWYTSPTMDLFLWINDDNTIARYHLTYDMPSADKALTWSAQKGFLHTKVDSGTKPGKHPESPLIADDQEISPSKIIVLLEKHSGELNPVWKKDIISKIKKQFS